MWPGQTKVQSTPDISNLALSGVRVIGSSKKIARSKVKEVFTVQWTFLSNVIVEMLSESWNIHLDYKSVRNVINIAQIERKVTLFHVRFVPNNISLH